MSSDNVGLIINLLLFVGSVVTQIVMMTTTPNLWIPTVIIGIMLWVAFFCIISDTGVSVVGQILGIAFLVSFIILKPDVIALMVIIHAITVIQMIAVYCLFADGRLSGGYSSIPAQHKHSHKFDRCRCGARAHRK